MEDLEKKYLDILKKVNLFKKNINGKFKTAGMPFDCLKDKIDGVVKLDNNKIEKNNKTTNSKMLENCIYCEGKIYICTKYEKREKCIVQNIIRKAGFDICFDISEVNEGEKCDNLIEIK